MCVCMADDVLYNETIGWYGCGIIQTVYSVEHMCTGTVTKDIVLYIYIYIYIYIYHRIDNSYISGTNNLRVTNLGFLETL